MVELGFHKSNKITNLCELLSFALIVYTFFFQYAVFIIPNFIILLSIVLLLFTLILPSQNNMMRNGSNKAFITLMCFIVLSLLASTIISISIKSSIDLG